MKVITDRKLFISTIILIVFHVVGIIGLQTSYRDIFIQLSSFNLLLSFLLLVLNHKQYNTSFFAFFLITYSLGFLIELVGIKTGLIFGNYSYGSSLGIKLFHVPLIIGINWFILIYSVGCILHKLNIHFLLKALIGSFMLVGLDALIEPIAMQFDFWSWKNGLIPIQNYVGWFGVSSILLVIFNKFQFNKNNSLSKALYITQLVFFSLLNVL